MIVELGNVKVVKFFRLIIKDILKGEKIKPYGVWMYVGLGGSGKTISMIEYIERMKKKHKGIKVYTNFNYKGQDGKITGWRDLIDIKDDNGVIFGFDEISGTFNAKEWKSFPYEVFTLLCQSRKMNKQIVCTAQSYDDVDVAIRRKCNFIIECKCLMGRWIFNKSYWRNEYERGEDHMGRKKRRLRAWRYSFIAGDDLRDKYDTYEQVELMLSGDHSRD